MSTSRCRLLISLFGLLAIVLGCSSPPTATPTPTKVPTIEFKTPLPEATEAQIVPTNTPVPPPPTPTPLPTIEEVRKEEETEEPEEEEGKAPAVTDIMVEIPAGPFIMGSDNGRDDEAPGHEVDLPAYEIDRFEVTNSDFAVFIGATGYETDAEKEGRSRVWLDAAQDKDGHPVVYVSWNDATAYCEWRGARLPTEAEWEKAARGTDGRAFSYGNRVHSFGSGAAFPLPVGTQKWNVSPYGVRDMTGLCWEWTDNWYSPSRRARVLRGGSWHNISGIPLRAAERTWENPVARRTIYDFTFRCAADAPAGPSGGEGAGP